MAEEEATLVGRPATTPARAGFGLRVARVAARARVAFPLSALDTLLTAAAYLSVLVLRFDGAVPVRYWNRFVVFLPLALVGHLAGNALWGLYGPMWQHASVAEARRLLLAGASAGSALLLLSAVGGLRIPLSVLLLGPIVATMLIGAVRFQSRLFAIHRGKRGDQGMRVAVLGAGESAAALVREMLRAPTAGLVPVAVLDDDRRKQGKSLMGIPVVAALDELAAVATRYRIHQAVLAIPSASQDVVRRVACAAEEAGVPLRVLPGVQEVLNGQPSVRDVRDLKVEDLLGRQQVRTDLEAVHRLIGGRRVLITGAGGSIGAEIARQVAESAPAVLVLVDHDETHLHDAAALLQAPAVQVLADIRDADLVTDIFSRYRPEVVFHAAAHKHVPLLQSHPCEAVATNVLGTANLVAAAGAFDTNEFVFISTDKAVRPANVMGASKRLGEQIVMNLAPPGKGYCAVRFGNVLGSRGSVIPTFTRQIAAGGPVTVTDPRMTRFFMSTEEAVQLVLQAAVFAEGGDVFMLEMGQPVNILKLAERMIRLTGRSVGGDVPVRITGMRPGEKLEEELTTVEEKRHGTSHPSVVRLEPRRMPREALDAGLAELRQLVSYRDDGYAYRRLFELTALCSEGEHLDAERIIDLVEMERRDRWSPSST